MKDCLLFDGGFSTELVRTHPDIDFDPLWSAREISTAPNDIIDVHKSFLRAGCNAILSATYQASVEGFKKYLGCSDSQARMLIAKGGELTKQACLEYINEQDNHTTTPLLSCASLGPYGACLADGSEYTGSYVQKVSVEEIKKWHEVRLEELAKVKLDLYIFETIPALDEVKAILSLIEAYPNLKFVISVSCKDESRLCHGEKLSDFVRLCESYSQVVAVGLNCLCPNLVTPLLESIAGMTEKNILVKANSGEIWEGRGKWSKNSEVRPLPEYVPKWLELGANWIGGCCRTTPDEIRSVGKAIQQYCQPNKSNNK